jgi:thioredoxin reductase
MTLVQPAPLASPSRLDGLPVAIIGSGPIGLAAAAHLVERGLDFVIYEAGDSVAHSVRSWGHIRLFSPWEHLIDPAARRLLEAGGWVEPSPGSAPSGAELVAHYLEPLAALEPIARRIRSGVSVSAVSRQGMDRTRSTGRAETPFVVRITDADGTAEEITASAVIDASGTYRTTNSLASNGLDPLGIDKVRERITAALPDVLGRDRNRFAGKRVVVVGAGHSAANALLALGALARQEPATTVTWVIRSARADRVFTADADELAGRASLGSRLQQLIDDHAIEVVDEFEIIDLRESVGEVDVSGMRNGRVEHLTADIIVNATGFRPDLGILREIRLSLDDVVEAPVKLAPLIDPNLHSCGTVEPHGFEELQHPEPNFFIAGMKSYGRAPTFLLATGYEQVRSITAYLAGDLAAARSVELKLPKTGVCSTDTSDSCCSSPTTQTLDPQ